MSDNRLQDLNSKADQTMVGHLGIELTERGEDFICGRMPVDNRTRQPYGILHGGASVALAETLGSYGSTFHADLSKVNVVGLEINANHIRSVTEGFVYGRATLVHKGRKTHIWDIRITDDCNKLVCISRLTVAIIDKQ